LLVHEHEPAAGGYGYERTISEVIVIQRRPVLGLSWDVTKSGKYVDHAEILIGLFLQRLKKE